MLAQANAQVSLLSMDPCSAYAPHYQTDAAELMYIRAGRADVVLMVDGAPMQRYLFPGDLVAVPPGERRRAVAGKQWGCVLARAAAAG